MASKIYVRNKVRDCNELGVPVLVEKMPVTATEGNVIHEIRILNNDSRIAGIIVQLPLPKHINAEKVINAIDDEKDVDGFKVTSKYIPATPKGIMKIIDSLNVDLSGKKVCLVGKGKTVGMPLIPLLLERGATLTICHSRTSKNDLVDAAIDADLIITAVGKPNTITSEMLGYKVDKLDKKNTDQIIIDVGINRNEEGKQIGDCEKKLHDLMEYITPYTNGVGLMTRISLLQNLLYESMNKHEKKLVDLYLNEYIQFIQSDKGKSWKNKQKETDDFFANYLYDFHPEELM